MGRCAIGPSSLRILTSTHWREQIALHAPSAVIGTYDTASDDPETVRRFRHRDHTSADGLGFKSPLRMNRLCYDEAHVLAAKITKLQSQYHIPSNADHLWAVTATPSHAKYLSENFGNIKVLRIPAKPRAAKYYPDTFNALRKMIISGVPTSCGQSLPKLITINTPVPLNVNDLAELHLSCTPPGDA
jgi:hypothetical protein